MHKVGLALALAAAWTCRRGPGEDEQAQHSSAVPAIEQPHYSIDPTGMAAATEELIELGRELYGRRCAPCHGEGEGDGPAAYLLYPKPRDFRVATYRIISTWDGVPTDEDLFRSVSRGIPGSAMPSWAHLSERERWALVHYIKTLANEPWVVPATSGSAAHGEGLIDVPPQPANDAASVERGRVLFAEACAKCHGAHGRGDGPSAHELKDDRRVPIRPRDLTSGVFKRRPTPADLYRTVLRGIPGTPMPETPQFAGQKAWDVVHFVLSLSSERLRERAEMKRVRIFAARVQVIPEHPDAGVWRRAPKTELHLMPLWWRYSRPEYLTVQAVHDGRELALRLVWEDSSADNMMIRPQDFRDAAAVQFATTKEPPFFAMGEKAQFVNLWMWKAEREADRAGFHDLESQYPNIGIDSYPNLQESPYEQPMRQALTLESDPTFITGWGAGNIVSDPTRKSAAEDLGAQGFGTLKARDAQPVQATGIHEHGSYTVVFRRSLKAPGKGAVRLSPGATIPVAFAVWNGSAGDRDGKKSVSIWQELVLQE